MKGNKGITLVALVITIIVMLILVAVSVAIIVDSDLIGSAEKAGNAWESADDNLSSVKDKDIVNNAKYNTINEYLNAAGITK